VFRCDSNGIITSANPAALEIFGGQKVEGAIFNAIFNTPSGVNIPASVKNGSSTKFTTTVNRRHFLFTVEGFREAGFAQIYGADITMQKVMEENLRVEKEKAEKATQLKDKFVSLVAHDLKSPFFPILGILRLMREDTADPISEKQGMMLDRVIRNCESLVRTIEDLLDLNMLQSGKLLPAKERISAASVIGPIIDRLNHSAESKGVTIKNEIPRETLIYADPALFAQVIQNLVANAIKFCGIGDTITLFTPSDRESCIAVQDTGKGIAENVLPDIFKHDVKTTTPGTMGEKGTGLGLPLAYDIMKSHGGYLSVASTPGGGSVFFAGLPEGEPAAFETQKTG